MDMMEFEERALVASAAPRTREGAPTEVAQEDGTFDVGRDMP
jgi:hypothetical protein